MAHDDDWEVVGEPPADQRITTDRFLGFSHDWIYDDEIQAGDWYFLLIPEEPDAGKGVMVVGTMILLYFDGAHFYTLPSLNAPSGGGIPVFG